MNKKLVKLQVEYFRMFFIWKENGSVSGMPSSLNLY